MAIVTRKLEFRDLLLGEFYLSVVGPDGAEIAFYQHPAHVHRSEVVRFYMDVVAPRERVSRQAIADELRAFRPFLFHGEQPLQNQANTAGEVQR